MIKKIPLAVFAAACVLLFSGCGENKQQNQNNGQNNTGQSESKGNQDAGYVENMLNIKKQAEQDIDSAVEKENAKIDEAVTGNSDYLKKYNVAEIETNFGKIKVKFYNDDAPLTVNNFLKLTEQKFYDGTKFHRVIKNFMIQGGDPNSKDSNWADDGTGGPGYSFKDEINSHKLVRGSLAMANSGANTNGSQFFIVTTASTPWLDGKHTNFGEVVSGMDVVDKIENVKTGANDHPTEDVVIKGIKLLSEK